MMAHAEAKASYQALVEAAKVPSRGETAALRGQLPLTVGSFLCASPTKLKAVQPEEGDTAISTSEVRRRSGPALN